MVVTFKNLFSCANYDVLCVAGRGIFDREEAVVVEVLASNAVSRGVVCGELVGPDKGHYHLQALWEFCSSSTAAVSAIIRNKVTPSLPYVCFLFTRFIF